MRNEDTLALLLWTWGLRRLLASALKEAAGITPMQFRLLGHLRQSQEPRTPMDLARDLAGAPSTASVALKTLDGVGLTTRSSDKGDARVSYVDVSEEGNRVLDRGFAAIRDCERKMSACFPAHFQRMRSSMVMFSADRFGVISARGGSVNMELAYMDDVFLSYKSIEQALSNHGIKPRELIALLAIDTVQGPTSQAGLARHLMLSPSELSQARSAVSGN